LELEVQSDLKQYWRATNSKSTRSYVSQIPVKALRSIGSRVVTGLHPNSDGVGLPASVASSDDATLRIGNCVKPGNSDSSFASSTYYSDNQSVAAELRLGYDDDDASTVTSDKATKDDNAEAVSQDWDEWIVSNFNHPSTPRPLVCTGSYDHDTHQPFFDSLRGLLMRQYKKNVLCSFLRYMRQEYFVGKTTSIKLQDLVDPRRLGTSSCIGIGVDSPSSHIRVAKWSTFRVPKASSSKKKKSRVAFQQEMAKDLEIGQDAVARAANSSWWSWDSGSTLFFWCWPWWSKSAVCDGVKLFVDWELVPSFWKKQDWPDNPLSVAKLKKKLRNVRAKKYVQPGFVKSLTSYFAVPKALTDIRVVYDATACGLNDALWAPNFFLPTVDSILCNASSSSWFGDIDLGEMFLNYPLDENIRPYAGVDVTNVDSDSGTASDIKRIIERWARCLMGFKPSPFVATQIFGWGEEIIAGDVSDLDNPFYWD
jgi:hypothetical protein